jgi:hypothetical protein
VNRRSILALVVSLLIMPLVRLLELWRTPAFRRVIINGVRYEWSSVRVFIDGQEFHGLSEISYARAR